MVPSVEELEVQLFYRPAKKGFLANQLAEPVCSNRILGDPAVPLGLLAPVRRVDL